MGQKALNNLLYVLGLHEQLAQLHSRMDHSWGTNLRRPVQDLDRAGTRESFQMAIYLLSAGVSYLISDYICAKQP